MTGSINSFNTNTPGGQLDVLQVGSVLSNPVRRVGPDSGLKTETEGLCKRENLVEKRWRKKKEDGVNESDLKKNCVDVSDAALPDDHQVEPDTNQF